MILNGKGILSGCGLHGCSLASDFYFNRSIQSFLFLYTYICTSLYAVGSCVGVALTTRLLLSDDFSRVGHIFIIIFYLADAALK